MEVIDYTFAAFNVVLCLLGFLICLFLLMSKKFNDGTRYNILTLCFFGFGWCIFLYASVDLFSMPQVLYILGRFCFLIAFLLWVNNNILQFHINTLKGV